MKRFATLFASFVLASVLAGCDSSGIKEGMGKEEGPATGIPDGMRKTMEAQAEKMKMKGKPAGAGKAKAAEEPAPAK